MFGLVEVLGCVFVFGRIAATDVAADEAFPKMDPVVAHFQALLAASAARGDVTDFLYVRASRLCFGHGLTPILDQILREGNPRAGCVLKLR
jgi:hypothetical protein